MAGLVKKKNNWIAVWYENGKPVRKSTRIHIEPTTADGNMTARQLKKLAAQVADTMERTAKGTITLARAQEALLAVAGAPPCPTVAEYSATYLAWRSAQQGASRSQNSRQNALRSIERLMPSIWSKRLDSVTPADAQDYVLAALDEVSASTVERRLEDIAAMFNRAVSERLLPSNPFRGCRCPNWLTAGQNDPRREPFTPGDIEKLLKEAPGEWPDMLRVCLLLGGQRLGDVATLQYSAIDWQAGLVRVSTKKNNKSMRKPLLPALAELLTRRKGAGGSLHGDYVFPYAAWRVIECGGKTTKLSNEFSDLCRSLGIAEKIPSASKATRARDLTNKTFHSLRSTAVTVLLCAGVPAELVRWLVGHDDPRIERQHYFSPGTTAQAQAMQPLVALLSNAHG